MKNLFVGTGRCGTAYLARYLTAAGLPTAHECLAQPFRDVQPWEWDGIEREVSWVGQFWLQKLPTEVEIIHVIRDPRKVYDSFMDREFFRPEPVAAGRTRAFYQGVMYQIDPGLKNLSLSEATERWILGTHERLAVYPQIFVDRGDLHRELERILNTKLSRREIPYTNEGTGTTYKRPAHIVKLSEELGYL